MTEIAFAVPVVPGKEGLDREVLDELAGSRRSELEAAMRDAGITRQTVWHQDTPNGTIAVVYMEMEDDEGERRFVASGAPVMKYFVDQMKEVHGFDISAAAPQLTQVFDVSVDAAEPA